MRIVTFCLKSLLVLKPNLVRECYWNGTIDKMIIRQTDLRNSNNEKKKIKRGGSNEFSISQSDFPENSEQILEVSSLFTFVYLDILSIS